MASKRQQAERLLLGPDRQTQFYDNSPPQQWELDELLYRLACGETLKTICAGDHMPAVGHVLRWLTSGDYPDFNQRFISALAAAGHMHAEKLFEILYKLEVGLLDPKAARVMVDAIKWLAERQCPQIYGRREIALVTPGRAVQDAPASKVILVNFVDPDPV